MSAPTVDATDARAALNFLKGYASQSQDTPPIGEKMLYRWGFQKAMREMEQQIDRLLAEQDSD